MIDRGWTLERPMFPQHPYRARCDACSALLVIVAETEGLADQAGRGWYRDHQSTALHRRKLS